LTYRFGKSYIVKRKQGVRKGQFMQVVVEKMANEIFSILYCFGLGTDGRIELAALVELLKQHPTWNHLSEEDLAILIRQTTTARSHAISVEGNEVLI
jgi:hypothetical protein